MLYTLTDPLGTHNFTSTTMPITPWAPPSATAPQQGGPQLPDNDDGNLVLQKTTQRNGVI